MTKSCVTRVPRIVIDELENIKFEEKLNDNQAAFHKMVKFSKVGREAKRIYMLDFRSPRRR